MVLFLPKILERAPQGMDTTPRLLELKESLDNAPRHAQGGIVGVSVQGWGLGSMILVGPFQLRIFCGSEVLIHGPAWPLSVGE